MRAHIKIDLSALASNISRLKSGTMSDILAVVKADAYGHGLVPVAKTALAAGATWLGVALIEEAHALRNAGITAPIIAWLTPIGEDYDRALTANIDLAVPSLAHLVIIEEAGRRVGIKPRVHIEIDTGMTRGGLLDEWEDFLRVIGAADVDVVGAWTHFARADEPNEGFTNIQIERFEMALSALRTTGINPQIIHLSNSAASLNRPLAHRNLIRAGIAMYGLSPDYLQMGSSESLGLTPVMTLNAKLHLVKTVPAGSAVGYGGTAVTTADTKIGIVAMGYADGIPRGTSGAAGVSFKGNRAPILGRVSMDQFVVDLGIESDAVTGDEVTVFGADGYSIDEWAAAANTINYEIVTRIAPRVPRIYG
jgi:alanine racemase